MWTFFRSALFAADDIIVWMFRVEIFPFLPVKRYFWEFLFCCFIWCLRSSIKNSGMLKILSLFPLACRTWPIFSEKFRSCVFRFVSSETRKPHA